MTDEERLQISQSRVSAIGSAELLKYMRAELDKLGFIDIRIEYDSARSVLTVNETVDILPFDFVRGAGAVVLFPGDERRWLMRDDLRAWMAEYIAGYSAFWNLDDSHWLREALPEIRRGEESDDARRTLAILCARIAANVATGREVKTFPRFYLMRSR